MNINSKTAEVRFAGLTLSAGSTLERLAALSPAQFCSPLIANGEWQTFRIVDSTAACHLVFRGGQLWQVRIALVVEGNHEGHRAELLERARHAAHEAFLLREIGATDWRCPDGSRIELCWDERNLGSSIVVTFAAGDPVGNYAPAVSS